MTEPRGLTVIDNFAGPEELAAADAAWPGDDWPGWVRYDPATQCKRASDARTPLPVAVTPLLHRLASVPLPSWAPPGLLPDLGLWGAGLHEMPAGAGLARHVDAVRHPLTGLARVLSVVLYVGAAWVPAWGGHLELPGLSLLPLPGRLVAFDCRGVPHAVAPVTCPPGTTRRSLALFWYGGPADPGLLCRANFEEGRR